MLNCNGYRRCGRAEERQRHHWNRERRTCFLLKTRQPTKPLENRMCTRWWTQRPRWSCTWKGCRVRRYIAPIRSCAKSATWITAGHSAALDELETYSRTNQGWNIDIRISILPKYRNCFQWFFEYRNTEIQAKPISELYRNTEIQAKPISVFYR